MVIFLGLLALLWVCVSLCRVLCFASANVSTAFSAGLGLAGAAAAAGDRDQHRVRGDGGGGALTTAHLYCIFLCLSLCVALVTHSRFLS